MSAADVVAALESALEAAQNELELAEIGLLEATARAEAARIEQNRLQAAVAALRGEPPAAAPVEQNNKIEQKEAFVEDIDEWERQRAVKMAAKEAEAKRAEKERLANDPMAQIRCTGCGNKGTLVAQFLQSPGGMPVRMLVCTGCSNQIMA
jgi:hypothetical protein